MVLQRQSKNGTAALGVSFRMFLLGHYDHIYRMTNAQFRKVLDSPGSVRYPLFVGQRIRVVDAGVQLIDRKPISVVRMTFHILTSTRTDASMRQLFFGRNSHAPRSRLPRRSLRRFRIQRRGTSSMRRRVLLRAAAAGCRRNTYCSRSAMPQRVGSGARCCECTGRHHRE